MKITLYDLKKIVSRNQKIEVYENGLYISDNLVYEGPAEEFLHIDELEYLAERIKDMWNEKLKNAYVFQIIGSKNLIIILDKE